MVSSSSLRKRERERRETGGQRLERKSFSPIRHHRSNRPSISCLSSSSRSETLCGLASRWHNDNVAAQLHFSKSLDPLGVADVDGVLCRCAGTALNNSTTAAKQMVSLLTKSILRRGYLTL